MDVIEDIAEIVVNEVGEHIGGAFAEDIDIFRVADRIDGFFKGGVVEGGKRGFQICDIGAHDRGRDIPFADKAIGNVDALDGGQLGAQALLQLILKFRIAGKAKLDREADDGRFRDSDLCAELGSGKVSRFFAMLQDIGGDPFMAL